LAKLSLSQKLIIVRLLKNKIQMVHIFISIQESFYSNLSDSNFNSPLKHYYIIKSHYYYPNYMYFLQKYMKFLKFLVLVTKLWRYVT